jgi:acyl carrier protein
MAHVLGSGPDTQVPPLPRSEGLMADDTFERIQSIVARCLGIEQSNVTPTTSFIDDLDVNSFERIELIVEFEDVFDIRISDLVAETIVTIQDAAIFIEQQKSRKSMLWPGTRSVAR